MNGFCSSLSPLSYAVGIGFVGAHFFYIKGPFKKAFTCKHSTKEHFKQTKKDQNDTTAILILIFY